MGLAYGYKTPTHSVGTVGTAGGTILAANAGRRYAVFVNDTSGTIFLGIGGAAAANKGIRLNPTSQPGDRYEMSIGAGNLYTGVVNAMSNTGGTANNTVLVTEGA